MDMFKEQYTYEGFAYEIFETLEMHNKLSKDPELVASYITDRSETLEALEVKNIEVDHLELEDENSSDRLTEKFAWNNSTTRRFLGLYKERNERFKNPKIKRRHLWTEILNEMMARGYTNLNVDMLDKKFRNLKATYIKIKENQDICKRKKSKPPVVKWEYYQIFDEMFADTVLVPTPLPASSKHYQSERQQSFRPTTTSVAINNEKNHQEARQLFSIRSKLLQVEQERVDAMRELKQSIDRSNEIQMERNELMKRFLDSKDY